MKKSNCVKAIIKFIEIRTAIEKAILFLSSDLNGHITSLACHKSRIMPKIFGMIKLKKVRSLPSGLNGL